MRDPHVGGSGEAARRVGWCAEVDRGRKAARVREEAGAAVGLRPKKNWAGKRKNPSRDEFNPFLFHLNSNPNSNSKSRQKLFK